LINQLDKDDARVLVHPEGPKWTLVNAGSVHRELEKVKFPDFLGAMDDTTIEAWFHNMVI
jgi:hypothetical protein